MKRTYPIIDMKETGRVIKTIMKARGFTVKDVQRFLELETPQAIYHWFDGRSMPTLDNIYALSELFHYPVDVMLRGNRNYVFPPFRNEMHNRMYLYYVRLRKWQTDLAG